ncbi:unnamed protein product [Amoebophrya sp. A120]|nr:unnamed protein product [Amoebophrya sp. A120]|eukprot:GSA120T00021842001.1
MSHDNYPEMNSYTEESDLLERGLLVKSRSLNARNRKQSKHVQLNDGGTSTGALLAGGEIKNTTTSPQSPSPYQHPKSDPSPATTGFHLLTRTNSTSNGYNSPNAGTTTAITTNMHDIDALQEVQREAGERRAQTLTAVERAQLRAMVQDRVKLSPRHSFCVGDMLTNAGGGGNNNFGQNLQNNNSPMANMQLLAQQDKDLHDSDELLEQQQLCLEWRNLTFTVGAKPKRKNILTNCYGKLYPGEVCALIGPSGAGKSTLMNLLAGRQAWKGNGVELTGEIRYGGKEVSFEDLKSSIAYVMQQDALLGSQTVEETLEFSAKLKLPTTTTEDQMKKSVAHVMDTLSLNHVKNVPIGDALTKGISGGQKKRVSAAIELLNKPSVLFLDEPTSGLDSFSSLELMQELKKIAESERAIICCTIHQPSSELFDQFDRVICMRDGEILFSGYNGKTAEAILTQFGGEAYLYPTVGAGSAANTMTNNPNRDQELLLTNSATAATDGQTTAFGYRPGLQQANQIQNPKTNGSSPSISPKQDLLQQFDQKLEEVMAQTAQQDDQQTGVPFAMVQQQEYKNEKMIPIFTIPGFLALICARPKPVQFNLADWLLHLAQSLDEAEIREIIEQTARAYEILNPGYVTPRVPLLDYSIDKTQNEYLVVNVVSMDRRSSFSWKKHQNTMGSMRAGVGGSSFGNNNTASRRTAQNSSSANNTTTGGFGANTAKPTLDGLFTFREEDEEEVEEIDSKNKQESNTSLRNDNFNPKKPVNDSRVAARDIVLWPSLGVAPNALKRKFLDQTKHTKYLQEIPVTNEMELETAQFQGFCSQLCLLLHRETVHRHRDPFGLLFRFVIPTLQILFYSLSFLNLGRQLVDGSENDGTAFYDSSTMTPITLEMIQSGQMTPEQSWTAKFLVMKYTAKIIDIYGAAGFTAWVVLMSGSSALSLAVPQERPVFLREYHSNLYKVSAYMVAKLVVELVLITLQTIIVMTIPYVAWGLPCNWFAWVAIALLLGISGSGIGVLLSTANAKAPDRALMMAPLLLSTLPTCFSGSFRPVREMPSWISWFAYITPSTFGLKVMAYITTNDSVATEILNDRTLNNPSVGFASINPPPNAGSVSEDRAVTNYATFVTARDTWWARMDIAAADAEAWWFSWYFSTLMLFFYCFLMYFLAISFLAWNSRTLY